MVDEYAPWHQQSIRSMTRRQLESFATMTGYVLTPALCVCVLSAAWMVRDFAKQRDGALALVEKATAAGETAAAHNHELRVMSARQHREREQLRDDVRLLQEKPGTTAEAIYHPDGRLCFECSGAVSKCFGHEQLRMFADSAAKVQP